jgi:hypothetical protein
MFNATLFPDPSSAKTKLLTTIPCLKILSADIVALEERKLAVVSRVPTASSGVIALFRLNKKIIKIHKLFLIQQIITTSY